MLVLARGLTDSGGVRRKVDTAASMPSRKNGARSTRGRPLHSMMTVGCQPSTAGQYFHLLRRQALRRWRKPLIVMTPKSMLRHAAAASPREELTRSRFELVIQDESVAAAERLVFCSGKLIHELRRERDKRGDERVALVAVEQLYPFPEDGIRLAIDSHAAAGERGGAATSSCRHWSRSSWQSRCACSRVRRGAPARGGRRRAGYR